MQIQISKHETLMIAKLNSILPQFKIISVLGMDTSKSTFKIYKTYDDTNCILKLFIFPKNKNLLKIVKILKQVTSSPNILQYNEVINDNEMNYLAIVEEIQKMNLKQMLIKKPSSEQTIWQVIIDMCKALSYWHKKGLVHARVKPAAIYQNFDGTFTLGEPDIHYMLDKTLSYGNMIYQSLEIISKEFVNEKSDIWSIGVVTYEMMNQVTPFRAKDLINFKRAIIQESHNMDLLKLNKNYSRNLNNLSLAMICINEKARPSLDQVLQFAVKAATTSELIDASTLIDAEHKSQNYVSQLINFLVFKHEEETSSKSEQVNFMPYSCMSTSFFRPGLIKPKQKVIQKLKPIIQLNVYESDEQDEYQVNPFLTRMPQFILKNETKYSQKHFKTPLSDIKSFYIRKETAQDSQEKFLLRRISDQANNYLSQHTAGVCLPKIKRKKNPSSTVKQEMFLHEIVKKFKDRQDDIQ